MNIHAEKTFSQCKLHAEVPIRIISVQELKGIIMECEESTIYVVTKCLRLYLYQAVVCNYSELFLPLAKLSLNHSQQL